MSARRVPHRFTVAENERMIELGILKEEDRVELIPGGNRCQEAHR